MAARYRVLYLSCGAEIGGAEVSLLNLLASIDRATFDPLVVVPEDGPLVRSVKLLDLPVEILSLHPGSRRAPWKLLISSLRLAHFLSSRRIDLVHANHEFANRYAALGALLARVPEICHVRNIESKEGFRSWLMGWSPWLIANSHATEESYAQYLSNAQRSVVIYNGVDLASFFPDRQASASAKAAFGLAASARVIAQVGRIAADKGIDIFIRAFAKLYPNHPDTFALIVGGTSIDRTTAYLQTLRSLAHNLAVQDRVIFTGPLEDPRLAYQAAELLVHPSKREPFGRTLIEAMAMGVPVVATDAGGPREIVEDEVSGLLVTPGDADSLAAAILRLLSDRKFAERLAKSGRRRVERYFSLRSHVGAIQSLYANILSGSSQ